MGGVAKGSGNKYNYKRHATFPAVLAAIVSSFGGLLFGYDLGVTGGVTSMPKFEQAFFPSIYEEQHGKHKFVQHSPYCKFNSPVLQLFPSSLYLAGFFSALVASYVSQIKGRKFCMMLSGFAYVIGAVLTTATPARESALAMMILGRVMLGIGVGFANASVPVYASEVSPPKYRGGLTLLFQWCTTLGILFAQLINYGTSNYELNGWRISMAIAAVPAIMILVGALFLPETPSFLIANDRFDEARQVLQKIRGAEDVEEELNDITVQTRQARVIKHPLVAFVSQRCYWPYLVLSVVIAIVHQLSGSNAINFYGPQLFATMGHGKKASLLNSVILGAVKCAFALVACLVVDKTGRRPLLIWGGAIMVATIACVGVLIAYFFHHNHGKLPEGAANGTLALICIFLAAYETSWGPLGWLIPAEIQPVEVRTAGMSIATATNMLFGFITGQTFLSMMCSLRFWTFFFFAFVLMFGIAFVIMFLPECKGVHIEQVHEVFSAHWFWSRFPPPPRGFALPEVALADTKNAVLAGKGEVVVKTMP